jgi:hypothetical protein
VLDYFAVRCCRGNISVGDVRLRWTAMAAPIGDDFMPLYAPGGVTAVVQRELVALLRTAGGRVTMRGWSPFRRPVLELAYAAAWLDFIGACRYRSPLKH